MKARVLRVLHLQPLGNEETPRQRRKGERVAVEPGCTGTQRKEGSVSGHSTFLISGIHRTQRSPSSPVRLLGWRTPFAVTQRWGNLSVGADLACWPFHPIAGRGTIGHGLADQFYQQSLCCGGGRPGLSDHHQQCA